MRSTVGALVVASCSFASASAAAGEALPAHDVATTPPRGAWSVGLVDPLRIGVTDRIEVDTHPVIDLLLGPNAIVRWAARRGAVSLTAEYGFSVPTVPMRLTQGYLFPSWDSGGGRIGWTVVPSAGFVLATGERHVASLRADTAFGVRLEHSDAEAPHLFAPIELWLAPATRGFRSRIGAAYDHSLSDGLRLRGALDVYYLGPLGNAPVSPLVYALSAGIDARLAARWRLRVGAVLYDIDTHRTVVEVGDDGYAHREHVRNRDVFPTADLIVTFGR